MSKIGMDMALRNSAIAIENEKGLPHYIVLTTLRKVQKLEEEYNITTIYVKDLDYFDYVDLLQKELDKFDIDTIILEDYALGAKSKSIYQTHEYIGVIKYLNKDKKIIKLTPSEIKKLHTGKGTADKIKMYEHQDNVFKNWLAYLAHKYKLKIDAKGLSDINDAHAILNLEGY